MNPDKLLTQSQYDIAQAAFLFELKRQAETNGEVIYPTGEGFALDGRAFDLKQAFRFGLEAAAVWPKR